MQATKLFPQQSSSDREHRLLQDAEVQKVKEADTKTPEMRPTNVKEEKKGKEWQEISTELAIAKQYAKAFRQNCLLYTSDAADE